MPDNTSESEAVNRHDFLAASAGVTILNPRASAGVTLADRISDANDVPYQATGTHLGEVTDGRDFRSPNQMPDGSGKMIWDVEQKIWFKQTVRESDATSTEGWIPFGGIEFYRRS